VFDDTDTTKTFIRNATGFEILGLAGGPSQKMFVDPDEIPSLIFLSLEGILCRFFWS
jgi:hypothetical protein